MLKKTDNGQQFSSSAYLVVPDPAQPETWRLRVETVPGTVTVEQLGEAAAALSSYRDEHTGLTAAQRDDAVRTLRKLYRDQKVEPEHLPAVFQQALHAVASARLHRNAAKLMEGEGLEAVRTEMAEDLACLQESHLYLHGLTAIQGGTLSFETVVDKVQEACEDLMEEEQDPNSPKLAQACQVLATFPGSAVFAADGRIYQVSYRMDGTEAMIEGEPIEVTAEFKPAPASAEMEEAALSESVALVESRPAGSIKTGRFNREANVIEGTTLITAHSSNGANHRRKYSDKALKQIAQMAEGIPAYANHVAPDLAFKPRDVRDIIGRHVNVKYDAANGRVTSDLHLVATHAPWVFSLAERMGDMVGNSLVSKGLVRMESDGTETVDEIVALRSGDLVSDPASTKGLFESQGMDDSGRSFLAADREIFETLAEAKGTVTALLLPKAGWTKASAVDWARSHGFETTTLIEAGEVFRLPQRDPLGFADFRTIPLKGASAAVQAVLGFHTTQEASDMEFNAATIATHLKDNTDQQKQVAELLGYVAKADAAKLQESAATLEGSVKTLTAERDTLKKKVDEFEVKEAVAVKRIKLQEAIAAHDLGKGFGKVEGVITETFVSTLMEQADTEWGKLLDDRLVLAKGVRKDSGPRSTPKDLSEHAGDAPKLDGLHARLAAAVTR